MRTTSGPERVSALEIKAADLTVWRIVRSDVEEDPALLNSFRSHYELGEAPRRVQRRWTVIHMGISAYINEAVAHGTAQRFPRLGDFVARLVLRPGNGFNYAHTGHPLHLTLWADPIKLREAVADIGPVWE